jgi:hypothetical protein
MWRPMTFFGAHLFDGWHLIKGGLKMIIDFFSSVLKNTYINKLLPA